MSQQQKTPKHSSYEFMVKDVVETLQHTPEELKHSLDKSVEVLQAASDMTKDELALVASYVKADLSVFAKERNTLLNAPFSLMIKESMWQALLDITDKTQVEWQELFIDFEHNGEYKTGDMVGLGVLSCQQCTHEVTYRYPEVVQPCIECNGHVFSRRPIE
ncbi:hypothetical protein N9R79_01935 [Vibrio sp.]|nr:hypothetical protein [Vibrio sp.]